MLKRFFFFIILFGLIWTSCKQENAPAIDLQSNYYPLNLGSVIVYDVDSTAYSNFTGGSVNYKFEIKDSVASTFDDLTGQTQYRIDRYKKLANNTNWVFQKNFSRSKTVRDGEEFMNNQRFVKIVFPPLRGTSWNGNSKNTIGQQEYVIENEVSPLTINSLNFDSTIVVKEIDEFNLIREDLVKVTYARNVGMIQKEVTGIDKNISTGVTTNGVIYSYKIKSFK